MLKPKASEIPSSVIEMSLVRCREMYWIPSEFDLIYPQPNKRANNPPADDLPCMKNTLFQLIIDVLQFWSLTLAQVAPIFYRYLVESIIFSWALDVPTSA